MSVEHFVTYEPNGRIAGVFSCPPGMGERTIRLNTTLPFIQIGSPIEHNKYYVVGGAIAPRPDCTIYLDGDKLKNVPTGSAIHIEDNVYIADGTDITLEFAYPGAYAIKVKPFPMQDWTGEYTQV